MKKLALTLMASSLLMLGGCGLKNVDNTPVVIKVNDTKITQKMIEDGMKSGPLASTNIDIKNPENKFLYLVYKNKAINDSIVNALLDQEAAKRKLSVTNDEVKAKLEEIITKAGGKQKFEQSLSANNQTKDTFAVMLKSDLLKEKLVESVAGNSAASDAEAKDFYKKNLNQYFKHPDMVKASHILIGASETDLRAKYEGDGKEISEKDMQAKIKTDIEKAKAKAEKILAEVKASPDKFEEIAKKDSDDTTSAQKGGDLGFFNDKEMVAPFTKVAFSTKPGEISNIVKTEFGFHIIKVYDRKKAGAMPFDEVKPQIKMYLEQQSKIKTLQKLLESAQNSAKIDFVDSEYDPKTIEKEAKELMAKQKRPQAPSPEAKSEKH